MTPAAAARCRAAESPAAPPQRTPRSSEGLTAPLQQVNRGAPRLHRCRQPRGADHASAPQAEPGADHWPSVSLLHQRVFTEGPATFVALSPDLCDRGKERSVGFSEACGEAKQVSVRRTGGLQLPLISRLPAALLTSRCMELMLVGLTLATDAETMAVSPQSLGSHCPRDERSARTDFGHHDQSCVSSLLGRFHSWKCRSVSRVGLLPRLRDFILSADAGCICRTPTPSIWGRSLAPRDIFACAAGWPIDFKPLHTYPS